MSWAVGYDRHWRRDIGYGVPSECDSPRCKEQIDRGLGYVCGNEPFGGEKGCGLYFCGAHLYIGAKCSQVCARCLNHKPPYKRPKPDTPEWIHHKLTDESWAEWRAENAAEVEALTAASGQTGVAHTW